MYLDSAKKKELFEKYGKSATDTGSPESQIALFTFRIAHLTEHLKANHKDFATERALKMLVGKRRRLLDYLIRIDINRYRAIIKECNALAKFLAFLYYSDGELLSRQQHRLYGICKLIYVKHLYSLNRCNFI